MRFEQTGSVTALRTGASYGLGRGVEVQLEALRTLGGAVRRRPLRFLYFVVTLGVSFGFIVAVIAIAHASWFRLPPGVADRGYVTALRDTAGGIQTMSVRDFEAIGRLIPEVRWFYVQGFAFGSVEASLPSGTTQVHATHLVSSGFSAFSRRPGRSCRLTAGRR